MTDSSQGRPDALVPSPSTMENHQSQENVSEFKWSKEVEGRFLMELFETGQVDHRRSLGQDSSLYIKAIATKHSILQKHLSIKDGGKRVTNKSLYENWRTVAENYLLSQRGTTNGGVEEEHDSPERTDLGTNDAVAKSHEFPNAFTKALYEYIRDEECNPEYADLFKDTKKVAYVHIRRKLPFLRLLRQFDPDLAMRYVESHSAPLVVESPSMFDLSSLDAARKLEVAELLPDEKQANHFLSYYQVDRSALPEEVLDQLYWKLPDALREAFLPNTREPEDPQEDKKRKATYDVSTPPAPRAETAGHYPLSTATAHALGSAPKKRRMGYSGTPQFNLGASTPSSHREIAPHHLASSAKKTPAPVSTPGSNHQRLRSSPAVWTPANRSSAARSSGSSRRPLLSPVAAVHRTPQSSGGSESMNRFGSLAPVLVRTPATWEMRLETKKLQRQEVVNSILVIRDRKRGLDCDQVTLGQAATDVEAEVRALQQKVAAKQQQLQQIQQQKEALGFQYDDAHQAQLQKERVLLGHNSDLLHRYNVQVRGQDANYTVTKNFGGTASLERVSEAMKVWHFNDLKKLDIQALLDTLFAPLRSTGFAENENLFKRCKDFSDGSKHKEVWDYGLWKIAAGTDVARFYVPLCDEVTGTTAEQLRFRVAFFLDLDMEGIEVTADDGSLHHFRKKRGKAEWHEVV